MRGWIKLDRSITEHWIWNMDKPFDRLHAWIDILISVNHTERKIPVNNSIITVEKGCMITSESKLAERWGWSRKKVSSFLKLLEQDLMLDLKRDGRGTYLKVLNYGFYQNVGDSDETERKQDKNSLKAQAEQTEHTNKKEKNYKNDNNYNNIYACEKICFAESVTMTNDEYSSLIDKLGEDKVKRAIKKLDNYKGSTGKEYKSDYRAILSWVVKALEEEDRRKPDGEFQLLKTNETQEEFERIMWKKMYGE